MNDKSYCPKLPDSTVVFSENGKYVFFIPEKPDWCIANENFAYILSRCDGKHSIQQLLMLVDSHIYAQEAEKNLVQLIEQNFFAEAHNIIGSTEQPKIYTPYLNSVHFNMTSVCNLKCVYCYAEERENQIDDFLSFDEYKNIIDEIYIINKNAVITCTGGEPLLNENCISVGYYCKEKGMTTFLLTNGTLIDTNNAQQIAEYFDNIRISVDGSNEDTHDALRGKGSLKNALHGIELLEQQGKDVQIAMTVTKRNVQDIPAMVKRYGRNLTFQPLYSVGRARETDLALSGIEYYEVLREARNVEPNMSSLRKLETCRNNGCARCAIAEGEVSISAQGDVFPCHMLHVPQFCAGNIRTQCFTEIYTNAAVLRQIRSLSVHDKKSCRTCPFRLICSGGCWARSYYVNGDMHGCDSFCEYEMVSIRDALLSDNASQA